MANTYAVAWTQNARSDLEEIALYIAKESSADIALKNIEKIEERVRTLGSVSQKGRWVPELEAFNIRTYREIIMRPWRVICRAEQDTVYVLTVIDGRRDIEERLP